MGGALIDPRLSRNDESSIGLLVKDPQVTISRHSHVIWKIDENTDQ